MQILVNLLILAALYALLAEGIVLVYRASRIFNFAHGDLMMLGGYGLLVAALLGGGNPILAIPLALIMAIAVGGGVYWVTMRPLAGHPVVSGVLVTVALGIILRAAATVIWGAGTRYPFQEIGLRDTVHRLPGNAAVSTIDAVSIASSAIFFVALALFLHRTPLGVRMRAVAEQPALAAYSGVNIHAILALSWALSTFAAVLAVMFFSARLGLHPEMWMIGLKAFVPALIGGMDSPLGVLPGALIVASVEVLAGQYLDPILLNVLPFAVGLVALWIRPWGLFGTREEVDRV